MPSRFFTRFIRCSLTLSLSLSIALPVSSNLPFSPSPTLPLSRSLVLSQKDDVHGGYILYCQGVRGKKYDKQRINLNRIQTNVCVCVCVCVCATTTNVCLIKNIRSRKGTLMETCRGDWGRSGCIQYIISNSNELHRHGKATLALPKHAVHRRNEQHVGNNKLNFNRRAEELNQIPHRIQLVMKHNGSFFVLILCVICYSVCGAW